MVLRTRRLEPVSRRFGLDRGQPIDRRYIESFLAEHSDKVRGHVLEIGDDAYSRKFGGGRIIHQDIVHVAPGYPGATIVAELAHTPQIPSESFDCIILTQTLHYIFDIHAAVATLERILNTYGNVLAAASFLYGKSAHELTTHELGHHDPDYPVTIAAVAVKGGNAA